MDFSRICNSTESKHAHNIKYAIWPLIASFIILVRNENRSWQKHFTAEENYFLFVFATCNFIFFFHESGHIAYLTVGRNCKKKFTADYGAGKM